MKLPVFLYFIISFLIKSSTSKDKIENIIIKDIRDNKTICVDFQSIIKFEYDTSYTSISFDDKELLYITEKEYKANTETDFFVSITKKFGDKIRKKHFKIIVKRVFSLIDLLECLF